MKRVATTSLWDTLGKTYLRTCLETTPTRLTIWDQSRRIGISDWGSTNAMRQARKVPPCCYIFIRTSDLLSSLVLSSYRNPTPLSPADYIRLLLSPLLSLITPDLWSSLALSSGWLLIALSVAEFLSCTIHQPTKWCYCRLGLCPLALVALPARSWPGVYKMY